MPHRCRTRHRWGGSVSQSLGRGRPGGVEWLEGSRRGFRAASNVLFLQLGVSFIACPIWENLEAVHFWNLRDMYTYYDWIKCWKHILHHFLPWALDLWDPLVKFNLRIWYRRKMSPQEGKHLFQLTKSVSGQMDWIPSQRLSSDSSRCRLPSPFVTAAR